MGLLGKSLEAHIALVWLICPCHQQSTTIHVVSAYGPFLSIARKMMHHLLLSLTIKLINIHLEKEMKENAYSIQCQLNYTCTPLLKEMETMQP